MGIKSGIVKLKRSVDARRHLSKQLKRIRGDIKSSRDPIPPLTPAQEKSIKDFWSAYGFDISCDWHRFLYAKTGSEKPEFITNSVFYSGILAKLNDKRLAGAWSDKAYLDRFVHAARTPRCVIRNASGRFLNRDFALVTMREAESIMNKYDALVIKPTIYTHTGNGVKLLNKPYDLAAIHKEYKSDYVIQLPIRQDERMKLLNSSSVNTIRINSALLDGEGVIMSCFVKVGQAGKFADNSGNSRFFIGIDPETGRFFDYAIDHDMNKHDSIPSGFSFGGTPVPAFDRIKTMIDAAHRCIPHFGLAFWDVCIEEDGEPSIIEVNLRDPDIIIAQATGTPFLGKYTSRVMEYIKNNR